jgi:hypothetical protein
LSAYVPARFTARWRGRGVLPSGRGVRPGTRPGSQIVGL